MQLYIKSKNSNNVFAGILKIKNLVFLIFMTQHIKFADFLVASNLLRILNYEVLAKALLRNITIQPELCSGLLVIT